jgi:hypothetical protein
MALIVPTASSTYADSVETGGGALRKYILAQYSSDANFEWVREVRAMLVKDELKYRDFREARSKLMSVRETWSRLENGLSEATIIVIDPHPIAKSIEAWLQNEQAEVGIDYTEAGILDACATALVAGTPIAYVPSPMAAEIEWSHYQELARLSRFAPEKIRERLGGGL